MRPAFENINDRVVRELAIRFERETGLTVPALFIGDDEKIETFLLSYGYVAHPSEAAPCIAESTRSIDRQILPVGPARSDQELKQSDIEGNNVIVFDRNFTGPKGTV